VNIYQPEPTRNPLRPPLQSPVRRVPSYLGEGVGNWLFYNGAGDKLLDFSGNENHGTINGPKWTDENIASWALDFDGVDDYVTVPNNPSLEPQRLTCSLWVKYSTHQDWGRAVEGGNHTDNHGYGVLKTNTAGSMKAEVRDGTNIYYTTNDIGTNLDDGAWHHICSTYDGTDLKIYTDATLQDMISPGITISYGADPTRIGAQVNDPSDDNFAGVMKQILLFERALTESEVTDLYEKTKPLYVG